MPSLLVACNGGGSAGSTPANNASLSFSTDKMQMLTSGKVRTAELQLNSDISSNIAVNI